MENLLIDRLFSVEGKTALVTGGSRGLGLMITRAYVSNGMKVYISSRNAETCEAAARELTEDAKQSGSGRGECIALPADLSTEAGAKQLAEAIEEREEALDVLVNNSGAHWGAPFEEYDEKAWDRVLSLNVKGLFHVTRELMPLLKKGAKPGDPGRVINIGSIDGLAVPRIVETYAYSASKAAVHHMTRVLGHKFGPENVTVNAIAPGFFPTKMTEWLIDNHEDEMLGRCRLGRFGEPEDIAGVALYLASKASAYVTGEIIRVDGGQIL